jgi:gas vesicle protein
MSCENRETWKAFAGGFILGGLIGAGIALIFAPKSGKETREDIKRQIDKLVSAGKAKASAIKEALTREAEELKAKAEAVKEALRENPE